MLQGKTVLLAVSGGIDASKMPNVAQQLKKLHCNIHVLMTENAANFAAPAAFETITGNKCLIDTFDRNFEFSVEHVSLSKQADLVLITPANADIIGKMANGIADDMLSTTVIGCTCPVLVSPAMNENMYQNSILQENLQKLQKFGWEIILPKEEKSVNGDIAARRMPSEEILVKYVCKKLEKIGLN